MTAAVTLATLGNGPAFSAYSNTNQTLTAGTWTKLQINTEEFDTNSCYDTSLYRFTPTVAGYYLFSAAVSGLSGQNTAVLGSFYKNGVKVKAAYNYSSTANNLDDWGVNFSALIYMNGSTDYVEPYGYAVGGTRVIDADATGTFFQAFLARGA